MSRTIEVCCNGASTAGHSNPLRLEYRPESLKRNVRLGLPRFVKDLLHIPARTLDLLELAAYIYAADRHTRRGHRDAVEFHAWSRRFRFNMRVRDVAFWSRADVQEALRSCLTFMTGHADFTFVFTGGHNTPPTSLFDQEGIVAPFERQRVALFSGGLDSLSGAVDILAGSDASLVLVSHHSQPGTKQVQRGLVQALSDRFPGRVTPYGFECTLSGVRAAEETQRSRAFLYSAIGFALARAYQTSALTIYENGVTSLNLRRREDLANARASRTTHPRTLAHVQRVLSLVADEPFDIQTPAFWLTKRDVVDRLVASGHGDLIASSVSCSRTFQREGVATQCGRCFQCVDRRLAVFAAGQERLDDAALYTVDITRQAIPTEESRTTTVDYLRQAAQFADSSVDAFYAEYLSDLADAMDALPSRGSDLERVRRVWELMRAHGENVRGGLLRVRQLYDDPLAPLPSGSLLSLVSAREHLRPTVRLPDAISPIALEAVGEQLLVEAAARHDAGQQRQTAESARTMAGEEVASARMEGALRASSQRSLSKNPDTAEDRRVLVKEFLDCCNAEPDLPQRIIKKHIWLAAGRRDKGRQFQRWQARQPEATEKDDNDFGKLVAMPAATFVALLRSKRLL